MSIKALAVVWLWCGVAVISLPSAAGAESLEDRLVADAADGQLDEFDFISACLVASGVEDECELLGWKLAYDERETVILKRLNKERLADRVGHLQAALHFEMLSGNYMREASDLRTALAGGNYNCLSAVAVMVAASNAAELRLEIQLQGGHVNLLFQEPHQPPRVVEPTAAGVGDLPLARGGGRRLSRTELLGKFYYNRGVEMLKQEQFEKGLELLRIAVRLDGQDQDARANLVAGINNWAAHCCARGDFGRAAELVEKGLALNPDFAPLIANQQLLKAKLGKERAR